MWEQVDQFKGAEFFRKALYLPDPSGQQMQELSQEKQRRLLLLGVKEQEEKEVDKQSLESTCKDSLGGEGIRDPEVLQDLRHIEEQMKILLKEKEQADEKLHENEHRSKLLQQEKEYYSTQAQTLQQSLSQLTADKQQTEAELKVTEHGSGLAGCRHTSPRGDYF
ncbi:hypothetical protein ILYODFUR_013797 [Ilyodon furcidens]|uniref:Uncharacterized protein n=1 Tax=Ilyodon furcidens TaxID=33524 RepID=A0ABV0U891_9TELE